MQGAQRSQWLFPWQALQRPEGSTLGVRPADALLCANPSGRPCIARMALLLIAHLEQPNFTIRA